MNGVHDMGGMQGFGPVRPERDEPPIICGHWSTLGLKLTARLAAIDTGCVYTGGFVDWAAKLGIAALDLELTDHTHTDFEMNLRVLNIFMSWRR